MDRNKREEIKKQLAEEGFRLKEIREISKGRNSNVYKLQDANGAQYLYKKYAKPNERDMRNRLETEKNFLDYCKIIGLSNVPTVEIYNKYDNWIIMSWLNGRHIDYLCDRDISQIVNFISRLNNRRHKSYAKKIELASEAIVSHQSLVRDILRKKMLLQKTKAGNKLRDEIKKWVEENLVPSIDNELSLFAKRIEDKAHWQIHSHQLVVSPSDVGIHNTIRSDDNRLLFFDFEYAGKDDMSKQVCDWIEQPEYQFTLKQSGEFIESLIQLELTHDSWIDRLKDIRVLVRLKWCLIMLRSYREDQETLADFEKVKSYYNKTDRR